MELTVSRIIWLVIGIALTIYSWGFRAFVKTDFMATIIAHDTGRVEIALKNVGTVDIASAESWDYRSRRLEAGYLCRALCRAR